MGAVTTLFARKVIAVAARDLDGGALLRSIGLDPQAPADVTQMLAADDYYALLERIARALPDATDFPLRVGATMACDDYGAFGLAWKTAPTLRGSLERADRYARLLTSVAMYEVRPDPRGAVFVLHREGHRRLGLRLSNEATLASALAISRQVAPQALSPLEVTVKHPAPADISAHEAYFGCPVRFGTDTDGILFSTDDLERPNRMGDDALSRFLEPHLDREVAALLSKPSFEQTLMRLITDRLSEGTPRAADIAAALGMSERTLNRRLSDTGQSYQDMLEAARRRLAEGLLVNSDHSIAEIAFLTGFAEQSSFTRAFRRWADQTPAAFRDAKKAP